MPQRRAAPAASAAAGRAAGVCKAAEPAHVQGRLALWGGQASIERIISGPICIDVGVNSRACGGVPVCLGEAEMPLHPLVLILDPGGPSWGKHATLCHCTTGKTLGRTRGGRTTEMGTLWGVLPPWRWHPRAAPQGSPAPAGARVSYSLFTGMRWVWDAQGSNPARLLSICVEQQSTQPSTPPQC